MDAGWSANEHLYERTLIRTNTCTNERVASEYAKVEGPSSLAQRGLGEATPINNFI